MRPDSEWCPSPNFKAAAGRKITCVVMHATATDGIDSPRRWLCDPASQASAHYLIGKTGHVLHLVREENVAWHAGYSAWKGRQFVNAFSVGIELVNRNDGVDEYPEDQLAAAAELVAAICRDHGVRLEDVVGHVDVVDGQTPEEKAERLRLHSDPRGFPWADFRGRLAAAGIS